MKGMSNLRIRGEWMITLVEQGLVLTTAAPPPRYDARLIINNAGRNKFTGQIELGGKIVEVAGRVKPGSPGIVSLTETELSEPKVDGVEALLYVPPFWPTIDYKYDMLVGILTISPRSCLQSNELHGKPFAVAGVKSWPDIPLK